MSTATEFSPGQTAFAGTIAGALIILRDMVEIMYQGSSEQAKEQRVLALSLSMVYERSEYSRTSLRR